MIVNELRIGNWIQHHGPLCSHIIRVDIEDLQRMIREPESNFYEPIKITEEFLLKLGFYSFENCLIKGIKESDVYFQYEIGSDTVCVLSSDGCDVSLVRQVINYIHEIENLYYAISKTEIECSKQYSKLTFYNIK